MCSRVIIITNLLLCFFSSSISAQMSAEDKMLGNSQTFTSTIDKKGWVGNMQKNLPSLLCQEDRYFVQCFQITHQECMEFTQVLVDACLNNANLLLPQNLNSRQGEYWGQMVGRCSYDLYERFMQTKKRGMPECVSKTQNESDLPKPSTEMELPQPPEGKELVPNGKELNQSPNSKELPKPMDGSQPSNATNGTNLPKPANSSSTPSNGLPQPSNGSNLPQIPGANR